MFKIISIVLAQFASLASLLGLYLSIQPLGLNTPWWHFLLILLAMILVVYLLAHEIMAHIHSAPKTYKSQSKINSYMCEWLGSGGRTVIVSRNMSWANQPKTKEVLLAKARSQDLVVCVEEDIPLTEELRKEGAKVFTYANLGETPLSRFTIVDFEKDGARVAVGVPVGDSHVIQEFQNGRHPYFAVATDLVKFLIAAGEQK